MPDNMHSRWLAAGLAGNFSHLTKKPQITTDWELALAPLRGGFTPAQIKVGFALVKSGARWTDPIEAIIDRSQIALINAAITWHTATPATFHDTLDKNKVRVTAIGYQDWLSGP